MLITVVHTFAALLTPTPQVTCCVGYLQFLVYRADIGSEVREYHVTLIYTEYHCSLACRNAATSRLKMPSAASWSADSTIQVWQFLWTTLFLGSAYV